METGEWQRRAAARRRGGAASGDGGQAAGNRDEDAGVRALLPAGESLRGGGPWVAAWRWRTDGGDGSAAASRQDQDSSGFQRHGAVARDRVAAWRPGSR